MDFYGGASMKYTVQFLETCTPGRLEELEQDAWDTIYAIKALKEYRKYSEDKENDKRT